MSVNCTAVHFGETLSLSGAALDQIGRGRDNGLAETTIGLHKNECVRADSPFGADRCATSAASS